MTLHLVVPSTPREKSNTSHVVTHKDRILEVVRLSPGISLRRLGRLLGDHPMRTRLAVDALIVRGRLRREATGAVFLNSAA